MVPMDLESCPGREDLHFNLILKQGNQERNLNPSSAGIFFSFLPGGMVCGKYLVGLVALSVYKVQF